MGNCLSSSKDDAVVMEYADQPTASHPHNHPAHINVHVQTPHGHTHPKSSNTAKQTNAHCGVTFTQLFTQLDPHLNESDLELWRRAIEIYFDVKIETSSDTTTVYHITSSDEAIIRKAFYSIEITMDDIHRLSANRLIETKKTCDTYIALIRYKVTKYGPLNKLGSNWKTWKKRYFYLCEGTLKYFEHEMTSEQQQQHLMKPKGEVTLTNTSHIEEDPTNPMEFILHSDDTPDGTSLRMEASSEEEKLAWMEAITEQITILNICDKLSVTPATFLTFLRLSDKVLKLRLADPSYANPVQSKDSILSPTISTMFQKDKTANTVQSVLDSIKLNASNSSNNSSAPGNISGVFYEEWLKAIGIYLRCSEDASAVDVLTNKGKDEGSFTSHVAQHSVSVGKQDAVIRKAINEVALTIADIENLDYAKLSNSNDLYDIFLGINRFKRMKSGWLKKEGHNMKTWKKRYIVLTEGWIRYYEDDSMETKKGELKLSRDTDIVSDDVDSKVFTVNNHEDRDSYLVMESETLEEKYLWIEAIREQISWQAALARFKIDDSKLLLLFRLSEKVLKLHIASGAGTIASMIQTSSMNSIVDTPSNPSIMPTIKPKASIKPSNSTRKFTTLGELMINIGEGKQEYSLIKPANFSLQEIELWVIAIGLHFDYSTVTQSPWSQWQERALTDQDIDIIKKAMVLRNVDVKEITINWKEVQQSGKVSQQMLLLNYYRETSKGWLKKEGHFMRTIKKRFFVLHEGTLRYYEKDFSEPPYGTGLKGEVKLEASSTIADKFNNDGKPLKENCFLLFCTEGDDDRRMSTGSISDSASVVTSKSTVSTAARPKSRRDSVGVDKVQTYMHMEALSKEDKDYWLETLGQHIYILEIFDTYNVSGSTMLHYMKLAEKMMSLHVASKSLGSSKKT